MPQASGASHKYAWMDHDPAYIDVNPPVINMWYEVYHAYDVRQLLMSIEYKDDEATGNDLAIRWTCDGNIYEGEVEAEDQTQYYFYKNKYNMVGDDPFTEDSPFGLGVFPYRDKRALDFKVEVSVTSAVGTNAHLYGWALYETLEKT